MARLSFFNILKAIRLTLKTFTIAFTAQRSTLHGDMVELERRRVPQRFFHKWFMGFRDAPASVIQELSQKHWKHEIPWAEDHSAASPGMRQLMEFLDSVSTDDR